MAGTINGFSLAYTAAGAVVMWSGIKGWTISATFKALLTGTTPSASTETLPTVTEGLAPSANSPGTDQAVTSASGVPATSNAMQALQQAAKARGWTGTEWTALQNVEMREAGFNPNATNSSSGAYGLAQALGHGNGASTQGTVTNEYGGFGLSNSQAQAANSGNVGAQALWMVNYIAATYGDPIKAWQHEQTYGWY